MTVLLTFAFVSGIITILSPCILPVLPIVLSGSVDGGKRRPLGVIAGFVAGFTFFTLALSSIVQATGIPPDALRMLSVVFIITFGLILLVPRFRGGFEQLVSRLSGSVRKGAPMAAGRGRAASSGFLSGIPVGLSLGLVWTPCVGPIMASVISLALTRQVDGGAVFITLAYTLGTSVPMFAVMKGGRALISRVPALLRNMGRIQKGFGVLMIVVGISLAFGWDRQFQTTVLRVLPEYGTGLTRLEETEAVQDALNLQLSSGGKQDSAAGSVENGSMTAMAALAGSAPGGDTVFSGAGSRRPEDGIPVDYGTAPPLIADGPWFNTEQLLSQAVISTATEAEGLSMEDLRGKVVLIDFWTYSCINCVRTIPYLQAWYEEYRDAGLMIIGVHTPEFEFEKRPANVEQAMKDLGVHWPVVMDNDYRQWRAYGNRYWPAHYFIDAEGRVRYFHFGEGKYEESEQVIRTLLREAGMQPSVNTVSGPMQRFTSRTPETYLGYRRARGFSSVPEAVHDAVTQYTPSSGMPGNGEWTLSGEWMVRGQFIMPRSSGSLQLGFNARDVFLVVEPEEPGGRIEVRVDGVLPEDTADVRRGILEPSESRVYQLLGLKEPGAHTLSLSVQGRLRLFAFTFG